MVVVLSRMLFRLTSAVVLFAGCNSALDEVATHSPIEALPKKNVLEIPEESLHFGPVWSSASFIWTVPLINHSLDQIQVTSFTTSCGCTVLSDGESSFVLSPGERRPVELKIDLRGKPTSPGDTRDFQVGITVSTADGQNFGWTLHGSVKDAFWLSKPMPLQIVQVEETSSTSVPIQFKHDPNIADIEVKTDLPQVSVKILKGDSGGSFTAVLSVISADTVGSHSGSLILSGHQQDSKTSISSEWPLTLETLPELMLDPPLTHLGALRHGSPANFQFSLKSRLNRQLGRITLAVENMNNVEAQCVGDTKDLSIVANAIAAGHCSFDLVILEHIGLETTAKRTVLHFSAEAY